MSDESQSEYEADFESYSNDFENSDSSLSASDSDELKAESTEGTKQDPARVASSTKFELNADLLKSFNLHSIGLPRVIGFQSERHSDCFEENTAFFVVACDLRIDEDTLHCAVVVCKTRGNTDCRLVRVCLSECRLEAAAVDTEHHLLAAGNSIGGVAFWSLLNPEDLRKRREDGSFESDALASKAARIQQLLSQERNGTKLFSPFLVSEMYLGLSHAYKVSQVEFVLDEVSRERNTKSVTLASVDEVGTVHVWELVSSVLKTKESKLLADNVVHLSELPRLSLRRASVWKGPAFRISKLLAAAGELRALCTERENSCRSRKTGGTLLNALSRSLIDDGYCARLS
ncbi:MAG: hypothetical protein MHM6MM_005002 [Cercozoa sp. M6MM]